MPRRREVPKRKILPDPVYHDLTVAKFCNNLMYDGKKSTAEAIVYGAFELIESRTKEDPLMVFRKAIENCEPMVEVKSRRWVVYLQVPIEVRISPYSFNHDGSSAARNRSENNAYKFSGRAYRGLTRPWKRV